MLLLGECSQISYTLTNHRYLVTLKQGAGGGNGFVKQSRLEVDRIGQSEKRSVKKQSKNMIPCCTFIKATDGYIAVNGK